MVTVGTFDGVHLGHRALLSEVVRRARETGRSSLLVTFEPHPLEVLRPAEAPPRLASAEEKIEFLAETGLDAVRIIPFTPAVAQWSPERFAQEILAGECGARELVIGHDHGFGKGRSGDASLLHREGERLGFSVDVLPPVLVGGLPVSSSRIRASVLEGRLDDAARELGRNPSISGRVVPGNRRGRDLGFPTANIPLPVGRITPPPGVYAARVGTRHGLFIGALHVGPRPVFGDPAPVVEVHLLDFRGDLYGDRIRIELIGRIREVQDFPSVPAMLDRIGRDVELSRQWVTERSRADGVPLAVRVNGGAGFAFPGSG